MADSKQSSSSRPPTALIGQMAGEYRLGRVLGEGGFGTVYEGEHPVLKRRAAVKVLHRVAGKDSDALLRFVSEAQAVNQIRSRHIVDIFSFGKLADGRHFYVMDLLQGEPLDRYLKRVKRLPVPTALSVLRPIAEALDVAHAAGIVHRDLKPQNVFLSWESTGEVVPKLLDFGVAKLLGDSAVKTVSGTPIGTPLYMSPEQARGDKVDARSDVYALGVLFHELITGERPITADSTLGVLMAHIVQSPTCASAANPALSTLLDAPILAMLEKSPDARPRTAGDALSAIASAAEQSGLSLVAGLPRFPRPEPSPDDEEMGHSSTLAEYSRESLISQVDPAERRLRSSISVTRPRGVRWRWLGFGVGVGLVLLGLGVYWLSPQPANMTGSVVPIAPTLPKGPTNVHVAPGQAEPSARSQNVAQAASAAPLEVPSTSLGDAGQQAAPDAPASRKTPLPKRRVRTQHDEIPSDLESPF